MSDTPLDHWGFDTMSSIYIQKYCLEAANFWA